MTGITQCDQIFFGISPQMRPKLLMMNFEILPTTAYLTSPAVPSEYLKAEFFVCTR